jgi:hypothetical protein
MSTARFIHNVTLLLPLLLHTLLLYTDLPVYPNYRAEGKGLQP